MQNSRDICRETISSPGNRPRLQSDEDCLQNRRKEQVGSKKLRFAYLKIGGAAGKENKIEEFVRGFNLDFVILQKAWLQQGHKFLKNKRCWHGK